MKNKVFRTGVRVSRTAALCVTVLCAGAVTAASAYTLSPGAPDGISGMRTVSYTPELHPRPQTDPCQAFLTSTLRQVSPGVPPGETVSLPAGQAAVLSLALGIRTVPGPLERVGSVPARAEISLNTPPLALVADNTLSAGNIAAYRSCRKEAALGQARRLAAR